MRRLIATFTMLFFIHATASAQAKIDSGWWTGANAETRKGLVNGVFDCLTSEHGAKLPKLSVPELTAKVDAVLRQGVPNKTLADALRALPKESQAAASGGEDYSKEKHGWFDGYYWGSTSAAEQHGFLVGYLSCGNVLPISTERVEQYRKQIDSWYEQHPSSNAKIADVLAHVRQHR
jgi:hypothetical protein